jgi:hypothetical protein
LPVRNDFVLCSSRDLSVLNAMKTVVPFEKSPAISFVTHVIKARTAQSSKPGGPATRPPVLRDQGRLRGMMLVRFAARRASNSINWL